jgi:hypothetical protein
MFCCKDIHRIFMSDIPQFHQIGIAKTEPNLHFLSLALRFAGRPFKLAAMNMNARYSSLLSLSRLGAKG